MGTGDREFGVVGEEDAEPMPVVAPETGIEPDDVAEAERSKTWGAKKDVRPPGPIPAGGA
jgi:hypothetical protein